MKTFIAHGPVLLCFGGLLTYASVDAFSAGNYLDSLSGGSSPASTAVATFSSTSKTGEGVEPSESLPSPHADIPDEHYSKDHPMAGWSGYAHSQWGGYLDNLNCNRLEEGKKSDYGDDVRWGSEVYLASVESKI